jgi:hypothetical protein
MRKINNFPKDWKGTGSGKLPRIGAEATVTLIADSESQSALRALTRRPLRSNVYTERDIDL